MEQQIRFCKTADGVRIAYATAGSGPPLVKAANWLNHLEYDWQSPIWRPLLDALAQQFLLVRYDERGNGLSDWNIAELSLNAFVSDLEAVVEAAGLKRFPLLGISQGGAVAIAYAVRHPERVSHLILLGAYARGWAKRGRPDEIERRRLMLDLIRLGWGQDNPAFRQLWTTLYIPGGTPEQMNWFNEMQRVSASPENAVRLFTALSELDVVELLPRVATPTLVLHSRGDAAVPYEAGRQLAARIPGARFVTFESNNHLLLQGEPAWDVLVEEIRRFLGAPSTATRRTPSTAPAPAAIRLSPGEQLAHYQIVASLGEGGMGVVYRARDTKLERPVALKLLNAQSPSDAVDARLMAEARAASALNHPNVATVYEVGEAGGRGYIAMEFVEGRPLSEQIPPDGLPTETVLRYGTQIAGALAHAHERGVVHRDLKSANVVIATDGQAKVLDFGLASRPKQQVDEATRSLEALDSSGAVAGTLHYMAPEILRGEPADERSDLWALGVVLYEMAAGKLPFEGRTGFELSSAILRETPAPLPAHVPPGIRGVVQRCLAKDPAHRYRSAIQVHAALEALSSTTEVKVPAGAGPGVTERPPKRLRFAMAVGTPWFRIAMRVSFFALVVIVGGTTWWQARKGGETPSSQIGTGGTGTPAAGISGSGPGGAFLIQRPSANAEANELLQRAMMFTRYQLDPLRARRLLEQALQLDPNFIEARVNYALTYLVGVEMGVSNDAGDVYRAEEELRAVLKHDPEIPRAHALLGAVHFFQGRGDLALEEAQLAIQMAPKDLGGRMWLLINQRFRGNAEEAIRLAREVIESEPIFWPPHRHLGELYREQGKIAEAKREQEKVLEQDPQNVAALRCLARTYVDTGEMPQARQTLERLRPEDRENFSVRLVRAQLHAVEGKRALALKEMDEQVLKYADLQPFASLDAAEVYAALGDKEKAIEWLDRSMRKGDGRAEWIQRDPLLAKVRNHPRFKQILDSIAFRRQQRAP
jgi:pimeloyl-ACP methyl ester carboxylesterase/tetratricopeptide (TPR) repeat protein/tRNA A-37 threonylcarbamoyl transferase component Bud32